MNYPKISIVTPSFNQGAYIEETILSVINQGYPNLEYIIIDGGSTDETVEVIKKYASQLTYWISEKDRGQSDALNKGLSRVTGDIIAWLNSDDVYVSGTFEAIARIFSDETIYVVNGDCVLIDQHGVEFQLVKSNPVTLDRLLKYWVEYSIPPQPSVFFRRQVLETVGYVDTGLQYAMDYDLWLRIIKRYAFTYVSQVFSRYRFHNHSKSVKEGGFSNFVPEWNAVFLRFIRNESKLVYYKYIVEWYYYRHNGKMSRSRILAGFLLDGIRKKIRVG